jgi:nucleotide-binding universal stress UspA family protein
MTSMTIYKHLLVATDLSEPATIAAQLAARLAVKLGATVTLAHVYDSTPFHLGVSTAPKELGDRMRGGAREALDKLKRELFSEVSDVHTLAIDAESVPVAIAEHARENEADLVVVGTRGRSTLARLLMGSVAEGIVRLAACDVLSVAPGSDVSALPQRVLAPTDFSDPSAYAVKRARSLAGEVGARMTLLHVFDPSVPIPAPEDSAEMFLDSEEAQAKLRLSLENLHETALGGSPEVDLDVMVAHSYAEGIVAYANDQRASMIVVGSFGQGAFERFLIGSVAERVIRAAHCPVLTVRAPQG